MVFAEQLHSGGERRGVAKCRAKVTLQNPEKKSGIRSSSWSSGVIFHFRLNIVCDTPCYQNPNWPSGKVGRPELASTLGQTIVPSLVAHTYKTCQLLLLFLLALSACCCCCCGSPSPPLTFLHFTPAVWRGWVFFLAALAPLSSMPSPSPPPFLLFCC